MPNETSGKSKSTKTRVIVHCGTWSDFYSSDVVARLGNQVGNAVTYTGVGTTTSGHPGNRMIDYDIFNESPGTADLLMVGPGTISGLGVRSNVEDALDQIRTDLASGEYGNFIFVGWSRGGYTTLELQGMIDRIAKKGPLAKRPDGTVVRREDVQFNAILFDPVAMNPLSSFGGVTEILPGFDNVTIVYAGAETRRIFPPVVPLLTSPFTSSLEVVELPSDHGGIVDPSRPTGLLSNEIVLSKIELWGGKTGHVKDERKELDLALESIMPYLPKSQRLGALSGYNTSDVLPSPIDDHFLSILGRTHPTLAAILFGAKGSGIPLEKLKTELFTPIGKKVAEKMIVPILKKLPKFGHDFEQIKYVVPKREIVFVPYKKPTKVVRTHQTNTMLLGGLRKLAKLF